MNHSRSIGTGNTRMYVNPHFNQTKSAMSAPQGIAHINPNFYSKMYEKETSDVKTSPATMIHVNPKFVNVQKLQNDLVKVRQSERATLCSVAQGNFNAYIPHTEPVPTTLSSQTSISKYKVVNVSRKNDCTPATSSCVSHTSTVTSVVTTSTTSNSKYKFVRNNNSKILPHPSTPKTTFRVSRYKTVPLHKLIPKMTPAVDASGTGVKLKPIVNHMPHWDSHKNTPNRKIDRRKLKLISRTPSKLNSCFNKSIIIRGKKFSVTEKSLVLVGTKCDSLNINTSGKLNISDKLNSTGKLKVRVNGRTYVQKSGNKFVRKQYVTRNRACLKKNNVPCPLFRKFGKCNRNEKGICTLLHDKKHVTICKQFLRGLCQDDNCLLSHQVTAEKMPTCSFYLQGCCNRENCPYLHVKLSDTAYVCSDFVRGYCERGEHCVERHVYICPEFAKNGKCALSKCPYPHKECANPITDRTMVPIIYAKTRKDVPYDKADEKQTGKNNDICKTENRRYYVPAACLEATPVGNSADEIHTTREKLGSLPSFIKL